MKKSKINQTNAENPNEEKSFSRNQQLAECAIMVALSMALFAVSELIPWPWAYGGGFTLFGQVPIVIASYRHGLKKGVACGFVLSIFELLFGLKNFAYVAGIVAYLVVAFMDYIIAFSCLGLGGMFKGKLGNKQVPELVSGAAVVCVIRFLCHFISGVTVWRDYTQSIKASVIYSVTYNGSYMLIETIITIIGVIAVGSFLDLNRKKLF